jgi:hypothetical protein
MHLPLTAPTFMRVLLVWLMLHMTATSATFTPLEKRGPPGRPAPPELVGNIPSNTNVLSDVGKAYPGKVLRAVLKDQLNTVPVKGKVYIFLIYRDGSRAENICNGGAHNGILIATFGDANSDATLFRAEMHHLNLDHCGKAVQKMDPFNLRLAHAAGMLSPLSYLESPYQRINSSANTIPLVQKNNRFKALGKARLSDNFNEVISIIDDKSTFHFPNIHTLQGSSDKLTLSRRQEIFRGE